MHRQKENWDNIHCMHVVPLNILFTSKGLSPAMDAFPPSRLNPKPAEVFNNSTQMTSFMSTFGSAIEHTQNLFTQITVNCKLCLVGFCFCYSDRTIQSSVTQTRTCLQVSQKWMYSIVAVNVFYCSCKWETVQNALTHRDIFILHIQQKPAKASFLGKSIAGKFSKY